MIKPIQEKHLADCLDVIHRSFKTVADEFSLTNENCPTNGAFMPYARLKNDYQNGDYMYAFYAEHEIVGFVQLSKKETNVFELEKLAVLPDHRHNGYGKQLIDFARNKVKEFGGRKITIGIIEENEQLKNWYLTNDFIHTGTKVFPHLPFTVGFMELFV